jgi:TP901 family phage tail tape measure protein
MASRFIITGQVVLRAPTNTAAVVRQIRSQLSGITATVSITVPSKSASVLAKTKADIDATGKAAAKAGTQFSTFGQQVAFAAKRFFAFQIGAATFFKFVRAITSGIGEAIDFERQMVRIAQTTGRSLSGMRALTETITDLSKTLGVSSKELVNVGLVLSQAGLRARAAESALKALAKSDLSPTFDSMEDTAEGLIAAMQQFNKTAEDSEDILGKINAVSAKFAVESSDIITAIKRTGGAFQAAGGNLEELMALFTSVRATTRESAETIATGFRTIFTRLQRVRTQNFLEQLGIDVLDEKGLFVGPLQAIQRLSVALAGLPGTDKRFAQVIEELGGFRQVSKVIPLIKQFEVTQRALAVAQQGGNSLTEDATKAQQALAVQISKVREEFAALIRTVTASDAFKSSARIILDLASNLIKLTEALTPIIPIIATIGALKLGQQIVPFFKSFASTKGGVSAIGFASGGMVPGRGNKDTVPAQLTPGEFVVRKSAVQAFGADNLDKINKYAAGGKVSATDLVRVLGIDNKLARQVARSGHPRHEEYLSRYAAAAAVQNKEAAANPKSAREVIVGGEFGVALLKIAGFTGAKQQISATRKNLLDKKRATNDAALQLASQQTGIPPRQIEKLTVSPHVYSLNPNTKTDFQQSMIEPIGKNLIALANRSLGSGELLPEQPLNKLISPSLVNSLTGGFFEAFVSAATQSDKARDKDIFDFLAINNKPAFKKLFGADVVAPLEIKANEKFPKEDIISKAIRAGFPVTAAGAVTPRASTRPQKKADGGAISDSVPALLTPGEYVVNRQAAQRFGYGNLNQINKFAKGGVVGSTVNFATNPLGGLLIVNLLGNLTSSFTDLDSTVGGITNSLNRLAISFIAISSLFSSSKGKFAKAFDKTLFGDRATINANIRGKASGISNRQSKANFIRLERERIASRKRTLSRLNTGGNLLAGVGGIAAVAADVIGTQRTQAGLESLKNEQFGSAVTSRVTDVKPKSVSKIQTGSALSGASTGAFIGGAIGSVAGPLGTLFGGALGGAIGAVVGFTKSLSKAKDEISRIRIDRAVDDLANKLAKANKKGAPTAEEAQGVVKNLIEQRALISGLSGDRREDALGELKSSSVDIGVFLSNVAKTSKSFAEFETTLGGVDETRIALMQYAEVTGQTGEEVAKTIKSQIELQNQFTKLREVSADFENQLRSLASLTKAAVEAQNNFSRNLTFVNSVLGDFELFDESATLDFNNIVDVGKLNAVLERDVKSILNFRTKQSGDLTVGESLSRDALAATDVLKRLPDVLIRLSDRTDLSI